MSHLVETVCFHQKGGQLIRETFDAFSGSDDITDIQRIREAVRLKADTLAQLSIDMQSAAYKRDYIANRRASDAGSQLSTIKCVSRTMCYIWNCLIDLYTMC